MIRTFFHMRDSLMSYSPFFSCHSTLSTSFTPAASTHSFIATVSPPSPLTSPTRLLYIRKCVRPSVRLSVHLSNRPAFHILVSYPLTMHCKIYQNRNDGPSDKPFYRGERIHQKLWRIDHNLDALVWWKGSLPRHTVLSPLVMALFLLSWRWRLEKAI